MLATYWERLERALCKSTLQRGTIRDRKWILSDRAFLTLSEKAQFNKFFTFWRPRRELNPCYPRESLLARFFLNPTRF
jgi:hypothetical protein